MMAWVLSPREVFRNFFRVSLLRNAFYLLLTSASMSVFASAFWVIVARFYSLQDVGVASALIAAMSLVASLAGFGFPIALVRFLPQAVNKPRLINSCLTIIFIGAIAFSGIFVLGLDFWSPPLSFLKHHVLFLSAFVTTSVAWAVLATERNIFAAFRSTKLAFFQSLINGAIKVSLPLALVSAGALGLFFSWGIGTFVAAALGILLFVPHLLSGYRPVPALDKRAIKEMLHYSSMNYGAHILEMLPFTLLPLLALNLLGAEATAYFRIAWSVSSVLFYTVPSAVLTALFAEGSHDPLRFGRNAVLSAALMLAIFILGMALLVLVGKEFLSLVFGSSYAENAFQTMMLLTLSTIPAMVTYLYTTEKMVQRHMTPVLALNGFIALTTVAVAWALAPSMGLVSLGIGWTLSQAAAAMVIGFVLLRRRRTEVV